MQSPRQLSRKANWTEFYKNGLPKEVIVIDDSSPEASTKSQKPSDNQRRSAQHVDKRRKTNGSTVYDPIHTHRSQKRAPQHEESSSSNSIDSSGRTASALYPSTAPTSMTSQSSGGHRVQKLDDTRAGQKRKRPSRRAADEESPELEVITQNYSWSHYVPPPKPPIKASEVYVEVVKDVRVLVRANIFRLTDLLQRTSLSSAKIDDDDGHFVVNPEADLTDRCKFSFTLSPESSLLSTFRSHKQTSRARNLWQSCGSL